jgi:hypothetical protein
VATVHIWVDTYGFPAGAALTDINIYDPQATFAGGTFGAEFKHLYIGGMPYGGSYNNIAYSISPGKVANIKLYGQDAPADTTGMTLTYP